MKQRAEKQVVPYSYLVDNIKVLLIFLVVFNHMIAFQLVKPILSFDISGMESQFSICRPLFLSPAIFPRNRRMW